MLIVSIALATMGALLGFLRWNWPGGKIFLGDGGAYLLGFILAELSVLLVMRNPGVSPWLPLLFLIYPVFETLFSIYRKKILNGHSPGLPDSQHLHMLIYNYVVPREARELGALERNNRVAKYLLAPAAIFSTIGILFWTSTSVLVVFSILFCLCYIAIYHRIAESMPD